MDISGGLAVADAVGAPGTASARVNFETDGDFISATSGGNSDAGDWIRPKAAAPGAYEIMAHQNSGDALVSSSALDTWLALSALQSWGIEQVTIPGSKAANLTISIRLGSAVLSSGAFTLNADVA